MQAYNCGEQQSRMTRSRENPVDVGGAASKRGLRGGIGGLTSR